MAWFTTVTVVLLPKSSGMKGSFRTVDSLVTLLTIKVVRSLSCSHYTTFCLVIWSLALMVVHCWRLMTNRGWHTRPHTWAVTQSSWSCLYTDLQQKKGRKSESSWIRMQGKKKLCFLHRKSVNVCSYCGLARITRLQIVNSLWIYIVKEIVC